MNEEFKEDLLGNYSGVPVEEFPTLIVKDGVYSNLKGIINNAGETLQPGEKKVIKGKVIYGEQEEVQEVTCTLFDNMYIILITSGRDSEKHVLLSFNEKGSNGIVDLGLDWYNGTGELDCTAFFYPMESLKRNDDKLEYSVYDFRDAEVVGKRMLGAGHAYISIEELRGYLKNIYDKGAIDFFWQMPSIEEVPLKSSGGRK